MIITFEDKMRYERMDIRLLNSFRDIVEHDIQKMVNVDYEIIEENIHYEDDYNYMMIKVQFKDY